ncbi:NHLP bacteriocin export ABC transporter permease/ATPase subunit [Acidobacteria bacterium ACD]|nr:MAG: NHLP bacteriocin export ABC transporter permease/ATPase subunit [Acidobacteriota bacterium]MCE7957548.1 NHLP bacteriocin export ABC transporter permease/ATPase subunit [Acidobacteria bacterium ACB2]MDL1950072.1 NHLP bacteriocin export ABC transporter permease/ATPase subunit [Acidobacteria bacterium ACD]
MPAWKPRGGVAEERAANAPIALDDPDDVFYVERGSVDVFSVPNVPPGSPPGARRFLWTIEPDELLLGFDPAPPGEGHAFVAVCSPGTRLLRVPRQALEEEFRRNEALVLSVVESFVARLADAMVLRPQLDEVLERSDDVGLDPGRTAGTLTEVLWVEHLGGTSSLGGLSSVVFGPEDPPIPMGKGMWLEGGPGGARLRVLDTGACLRAGGAFAGFARLRTVFHGFAERVAELEEQREQARLDRKAAAEDQMRSRGLTGLAGILTEAAPLEAVVGDAGDALVRACRIVGDRDGIAFKPPPKWETQSRARDPLAALCRASRVRCRRVTLRGEWWRHDCGNLLGFVDRTEAPVALLHGRRGYELVDPATMARSPLTRDLAATLNWEAYVFYRALPDAKVDGRGLVQRVWAEARPDIRFVLGLALASGVLSLLVPVATEHMLGMIVPAALTTRVWTLMLGLIAVHVGVALFNLTRAFALVRLEGRANASLQSAVVDRLLALPVPFFRDNPVGELAMRALSVNAARAVVTGAAPVSVLAGVFSVVYLALLVAYDWRLAGVALVVVVGSAAFVVVLAGRAVELQRASLAVRGKVGALVFQMITGIAKLRVAAAESRLFARWAEGFREQSELNLRLREYQNAIRVFGDLLPLVSSLLLFAAAGHLAGAGRAIDTATFIAFNAAYGSLFAALVCLSDTVVQIMSVPPIVERASPILEAVPEVELTKPDPGALTGRIEVCHVTFAYKKDGPLVLDDVSLEARPGEFVAVVGPSGSGKSTLLRTLLGFETPDGGVLYYDGQDLAAVDLSAVRSQMGVVLQNSSLLAGTIFDNIVGSAPLSIEDAWAAADMAGLSADVRALPMGMHTIVSEGGGNLSGGQRQRLLIARALVRKPRILFFDEATSALDNRVQEQVSRSLERLNATRVVIAHRLSTIRNADRIYVMQGGKVVQSGSYDELAARPGLFAELMARQVL